MSKQKDDQASVPASRSTRAFAVLDKMRAAVQQDDRPRFCACTVPQLPPCRIARFQPEVLFVLRQELSQLGINSAAQITGMDSDDGTSQRLRQQCLRLIQRALVPPDHTVLLAPGDEGLQRLSILLPPDVIAATAVQVCQFNEFWPS